MARAEPPELSKQIRVAREEAGLTQEQLAAKLGMSASGYRLLEREREPSHKRLRQIALVLDKNENYFLGEETQVLREAGAAYFGSGGSD